MFIEIWQNSLENTSRRLLLNLVQNWHLLLESFWKIILDVWRFIFDSTSLQFEKQPPEVFYKKSVLRNFTKFTGKHQSRSLFFNKVAGLRTHFFAEHLPMTSSAIWSISASIFSIIEWKAYGSNWSPSELTRLFKNDPRCFKPPWYILRYPRDFYVYGAFCKTNFLFLMTMIKTSNDHLLRPSIKHFF